MLKLKSQLRELENTNLTHLKQDELDVLIDNMLENIGSIDPELRDSLIFPTFLKLIDGEILSSQQYQDILEICFDYEHLFFRIGDKYTDSVFTRSFSSLIIAGLLNKDSQLGFFSEDTVKYAFSRSIEYLKNERDTRGYVEVKGWAHSIAHGADLLVAQVKHPKFKMEDSKEILNTIHNCLLKDAAYIDEEDERLVFVIEALIDKNIPIKSMEDWIGGLLNDLELIYAIEGFSNNYFRTKFNITNFLKSLYFIIGFKNEKCRLRELINSHLKSLHQKLYGVSESITDKT